jgi:hypothetical protein
MHWFCCWVHFGLLWLGWCTGYKASTYLQLHGRITIERHSKIKIFYIRIAPHTIYGNLFSLHISKTYFENKFTFKGVSLTSLSGAAAVGAGRFYMDNQVDLRTAVAIAIPSMVLF